MDMVSVDSSQIAAIGFDGASTMRVLFRRGGLYEYSGVSVHEYNDVLYAPSVGSAFGKIIKGAKPFVKLEQAAPTAESPKPKPSTPAQPDPEPVAASADPQVQKVSKSSHELVERSRTVAIIDAATQESASELLLAIAGMRGEIASTFKPMKDAAHKAHKTICDQERALDAPLLEAERTLKQAIGGFIAEQQRIAREAEERERMRLREEADAKAREESERLALEDAVALEEEGRTEEAEAVLANPMPVPATYVAPAPIAPSIARVKGVSTRTVWKFRITDETKIPREYLVVNESAIGAVVSRTEGKIRIPGIETYPDQQVAASRRGA